MRVIRKNYRNSLMAREIVKCSEQVIAYRVQILFSSIIVLYSMYTCISFAITMQDISVY